MHADIAANSDSTLRYCVDPRSPDFTIAESFSTMWVCGEIGYAQITSGRLAAIAAATACEPSICRSTDGLHDVLVGGSRGGDVAVGQPGVELLADGRLDGVDR